LVAFREYVIDIRVFCSFFAVYVSFSCIVVVFFLSALVVANKGIHSFIMCMLLLQQCHSLHPAPQGYAPSLVWQKRQEADFSEMRQVTYSPVSAHHFF